jgi:hypothetical protein
MRRVYSDEPEMKVSKQVVYFIWADGVFYYIIR